MSIWALYERIIYSSSAEEHFAQRVLFFPLFLVSLLYRLFIQLRYLLYQSGALPSSHFPCRVISVGNITVGGTGKTPTVIYLAQLLGKQNKKMVVLSRGYKGKSSEKTAVVSDGVQIILDAKDAGDEPYLISKALPGVPVLIGKDRVRTGQYALKHFFPQVVLLDDGFQHLKLKRDVDILLIDLSYGFGNGHLLPRGILREPLHHLKRAHLFLLTKKIEGGNIQALVDKITSYKPDAQIFFASYELKMLTTLDERKELDVHCLKGKKVLALSGIANPRYFSHLLQQHGAMLVEEIHFPDHHTYTPRDAEHLEEHLNRIDYIITTTKDSVKMESEPFKKLPILVLEIMLRIHNEHAFKDALSKLIPELQ